MFILPKIDLFIKLSHRRSDPMHSLYFGPSGEQKSDLWTTVILPSPKYGKAKNSESVTFSVIGEDFNFIHLTRIRLTELVFHPGMDPWTG